MFYSVFVLGKKGPLARVWLAAHWDKKITKAQILETNIVESVDSILQPRVKLSLRTSSHLLLGIVRIYARKTLYLLQDCQDAAFKIKSAFRPGAVDMPDGKTEAAIAAITLPEMLDFVNDFDLIAEPPIQIEHPHTNANIRSITLQEDMSSIHVDDPLLHEVRDWGDLSSIRGAASTDDHTLNDTTLQIPTKEAHPLDIFDRPIDDDGFCTGAGDADVDDMFALPVPPEAHEQMQAEKEQREREARGQEPERPLSRLSERSDRSEYSAPASMAPSGPPSTPGSVPPPPDMDEDMPQNDIFNQDPQHLDSLPGDIPSRKEPGTQDTMVLEPLEGPGLERRRKRRKKLGIIIDEVKTLSGEEMKSQLSDTSDIISTLDLAPPTKKLMHWKKTGGSEKLFALPERPLMSRVLVLYYTRNLVTSRIETEEEYPEEELLNGDADQDHLPPQRMSVRRSERIPEMEELQLEKMLPPASPTKARKPYKKKDAAEKEKSPAKKRRKQDKENEGSQTPRAKTPRAADNDRFQNHISENDFDITENSIHAAREGSTLPSYGDFRPSAQSVRFQDDDDNYQDNYDQPLSVGPNEEMMPDETTEQFEERVRNKRTNVLLRFMATQLEEGDMTFSHLVKSNRRKQVAQKFYSLLVLKKQQAIELSQDMSVEYGEIIIKAGPRYEAALASSSL